MNLKDRKISFLAVDIFLFLIIFFLVFILFFEKKYDNKIYPNIYLNGFNLGSLTRGEAKDLINKEIERFDNDGIRILLEDKEIIWRRDIFSFDPDLASQSVFFDINKTLDDAFFLGRNANFFDDFIFKVRSFFVKREIFLSFYLDEEKIKQDLKNSFVELENVSQDAQILSNQKVNENNTFNEDDIENEIIDENKAVNEEIVFSLIPEIYGREVDYEKFFQDFSNNLESLNNKNIYLGFIDSEPKIKLDEIRGIENQAYAILDLAPFNLKYIENKEEKIVEVNKGVFSTWLKLEKQGDIIEGEKIIFSLDFEELVKFFENNVVEKTNKEPIRPQFEFDDGRVKLFFPGQDGLKLNYEKSFKNILNAFLMKEMNNIFLEVDIDIIEKVDSINDLGIKELIGSGHSNFAGSPVNRRHNIRVGAEKISGTIVAPGEEFSTVKTLGPTNREAGYLPELVIKGNRTIPEYGGGLCQIATTLFRSALGSGFPITERRNHSYRVSYYEPAGTDATIYSPRPDFKFKNDTEHNILIQARFEGNNDIYFDIWGTSDGRVASTTYPVIYNIVSPGPTQIIETTDLKPGERKCTERAHSGASAYFDYKVIYNPETENENIVETRFHSKYVPWREVCLVGVELKNEEKSPDLEE